MAAVAIVAAILTLHRRAYLLPLCRWAAHQHEALGWKPVLTSRSGRRTLILLHRGPGPGWTSGCPQPLLLTTPYDAGIEAVRPWPESVEVSAIKSSSS